MASSAPEPAGRALLVGAPLGDLGGVDESVALLGELLEARGFTVERLVGPAARRAAIVAAIERLREQVRPGDAVVLYWAGHGYHVWDPARPAEVYPVLLPMDARESTADDPRAILGAELARWLVEIARAAAHEDTANVTAILECCHAAGLIDGLGLDAAGLEEARRRMGAVLAAEAKARTRASWPRIEQQIVRVAASGMFSRAYGDGIATIGAVTRTLVELLGSHPHQPWWALEPRLRARIHAQQAQQQPGVEGRRERLPFTTLERAQPEGALPCTRDDEGRWRCELGELLAARGGGLYRFTDDLDMPGGGLARMDESRGWLQPLVADDAAPGTMRWALPVDLARGLRVELRQARGSERSAALERGLMKAGVILRQAPTGARARHESEAAPAIVLKQGADGAALCDAWGEAVVRWASEPPLDALLAWVSRLSELHRWLAAAQAPSPMLEGAFELRWGVHGADGEREAMDAREGVELANGAAAWIELRNLGMEPRLYLSVFRVTSERAVEHLTADGAGGLPSTTSRPARLGLDATRRIVLSRSAGLATASEALVSIVTLGPLPLHGLERKPIHRGSSTPRTPARAMVVARYRLVDRT